MKFEKSSVMNFENALYGMRNPMNSWEQSDSYEQIHLRDDGLTDVKYIIGKKDIALAQKLIKAGGDHRKFLRQIIVSVNITAPRYWWSEFDTYKVGTVANSTSTMYKLSSTPITPECFALDGVNEMFSDTTMTVPEAICNLLENYRQEYLKTKDKRVWRALVQLLPASWLQTRTVTMNYENLLNMYHARKNHKLTEWSDDFCCWVKSLPYAKELLIFE